MQSGCLRLQVSILFADIKGFTAMCQLLHPSQVLLFLNHLYGKWQSGRFGCFGAEVGPTCTRPYLANMTNLNEQGCIAFS